MDTWRIFGAAVVGIGGLLMVMVAMAQARDSGVRGRMTAREGRHTRVAQAAGIGLALLAVLLLLTLTVLPQYVVWAVAAAVWLILLALFLVG